MDLARPVVPPPWPPGRAPRIAAAGDRADRADRALERLLGWAEAERARRAAEPAARHTFDAHGDLVAIVEADGRRRTFGYDAARRLAEVHDGRGTTRYRYDAADRLVEVDGPALRWRYAYDAAGRLAVVHRGDLGGVRYRHDAAGRVVEYRTAEIACGQHFDAAGRIDRLTQTMRGIPIEAGLSFDGAGRLASIVLPGHRIDYAWDAAGRPERIALDGREIARYRHRTEGRGRVETVVLAGGIERETIADPIDGRVLARTVRGAGGETLLAERLRYDAASRLVDDGHGAYRYDPLGRLVEERPADGRVRHYCHGADGGRRPCGDGPAAAPSDAWRIDALGRLVEAQGRDGRPHRIAEDPKGRLAAIEGPDGLRRFLYGPADELLAVTDGDGRVQRILLPTPSGVLAEWIAGADGGALRFPHLDRRGASRLVTDDAGRVVARPRCDAYGAPLDAQSAEAAWFGGHRHEAAFGLYRFGARWYDPRRGHFLTPDSHTAAPDDERLVHPLFTGAAQRALRTQLLPGWLGQAAARHPTAFCAGDPVNRVDPNGHWSFGGVLLTLLGAIWTLPNTLFGLVVEITCLIGEVVRWLVWLFSAGHVSWATPGFDAASSSHLNAFALVFRGGWLGSFRSLLGITFGNVFFVYDEWESVPELQGEGTVKPPAYGGEVEIPKKDALYEHELRHTNQYGWLGPFFHLGLPLFGFYEWDVIFHGYADALLEVDAREHGGF